MTKVCERRYYDKILINIEGHSGYAKSGEDIVCAGVSALVCTLLNCINDEEADGRLKLHKNIVRDGYVCIEVEAFDFAENRVEAIIETCMKGLYMLSCEYPKYITFE